MATTSLQSLHRTVLSHRRFNHHSLTSHSPEHFSLVSNPRTRNYKLFSNVSSSSLTATTPVNPSSSTAAATSSAPSLDLLSRHLSAGDFRQADEVTRRLLIELAGEGAKKRGYVFFSEVQFISPEDLRQIDRLWRSHSGGRFGYSVQRRIWEKSRRDFTRFFIKLGWMKKLETEVEQYNYRSFPDEFIWELSDRTPEGHLPLTNALRGTQLLGSILTHPGFDGDGEEGEIGGREAEQEGEEEESGEEETKSGEKEKGKERAKSLMNLKPDYSF